MAAVQFLCNRITSALYSTSPLTYYIFLTAHTHTHVEVSEDCLVCKMCKGVKYVEIIRVSTCPIMLGSLAKKLFQQLKRNSINAPFPASLLLLLLYFCFMCAANEIVRFQFNVVGKVLLFSARNSVLIVVL